VLAGGALSGSAERHPIAGPAPEPIGSAMSYDADIDRARRLLPLVTEGFAANLTEAATRFALSHPAMGTLLVGMATPQQFEDALAAVQKGPLPRAALDRLSALRQAFSGEPRQSLGVWRVSSLRRHFSLQLLPATVVCAAINGCVHCVRALSNPEPPRRHSRLKCATIAPHENPNHECKVRDAKGGTPNAPR
jgi:hypothetical protein